MVGTPKETGRSGQAERWIVRWKRKAWGRPHGVGCESTNDRSLRELTLGGPAQAGKTAFNLVARNRSLRNQKMAVDEATYDLLLMLVPFSDREWLGK